MDRGLSRITSGCTEMPSTRGDSCTEPAPNGINAFYSGYFQIRSTPTWAHVAIREEDIRPNRRQVAQGEGHTRRVQGRLQQEEIGTQVRGKEKRENKNN